MISVHTHGWLEVPIEALYGIGLRIMTLLKGSDGGENGSEGDNARYNKNWKLSLQDKNMNTWALVFERTP